MVESSLLDATVMPIVRVAVVSDSRMTEIALPTQLPVREILPTIIRLVCPDLSHEATMRSVSLAPVGGAPFSLDASLDTVGVVDGDLLMLRPIPTGPAATGIIEDIADATAFFSPTRHHPWTEVWVRRFGLSVWALSIVCVAMMMGLYRWATGSTSWLIGLAGLSLISIAVGFSTRSPVAYGAGLVPVGALGLVAIPGGLGAPQVMVSATAIIAWSVIVLLVDAHRGRGVAFFTTMIVTSVGIACVGLVSTLWCLPWRTRACILITIGVCTVISAPYWAALWARLPLPTIPAPGDPTPSPLPTQILTDLPRRVRLSQAYQTGLIAGSVLLLSTGGFIIGSHPTLTCQWGWYLLGATGLASLLRARIWDSAACKLWLLFQPIILTVSLLISYLLCAHYTAAIVAGILLITGASIAMLVAYIPHAADPSSYSLPLRRAIGFLAYGIDASLLPVMAIIVGLFSWVLSR